MIGNSPSSCNGGPLFLFDGEVHGLKILAASSKCTRLTVRRACRSRQTASAQRPMMAVFNNLVIYDQQVKQKDLVRIAVSNGLRCVLNWSRSSMGTVKVVAELFGVASSTAKSSSYACAGIFGSSSVCVTWWR